MAESLATPVSPVQFRRAFRNIAGPVAVVLTRVQEGGVRGITCTSVTSLSADPPLVTFAVDLKTLYAEEVSVTRTFSVNFLTAGRQEWAKAFARGGESLDELSSKVVDGRTGVPVLGTGTTAVLECGLQQIYPGGDHRLIIGSVLHARVQSDAPGLSYLAGGYGTFTSFAEGS